MPCPLLPSLPPSSSLLSPQRLSLPLFPGRNPNQRPPPPIAQLRPPQDKLKPPPEPHGAPLPPHQVSQAGRACSLRIGSSSPSSAAGLHRALPAITPLPRLPDDTSALRATSRALRYPPLIPSPSKSPRRRAPPPAAAPEHSGKDSGDLLVTNRRPCAQLSLLNLNRASNL